MRIGEFARRAGVSASAVRFYEKRGLLPASPRLANGYRSYDETALAVLRLIDQARTLGFSLEEVARFMSQPSEARRDKARLLPVLEDRLARLDAHLAAVHTQREALLAFTAAIRARAAGEA